MDSETEVTEINSKGDFHAEGTPNIQAAELRPSTLGARCDAETKLWDPYSKLSTEPAGPRASSAPRNVLNGIWPQLQVVSQGGEAPESSLCVAAVNATAAETDEENSLCADGNNVSDSSTSETGKDERSQEDFVDGPLPVRVFATPSPDDAETEEEKERRRRALQLEQQQMILRQVQAVRAARKMPSPAVQTKKPIRVRIFCSLLFSLRFVLFFRLVLTFCFAVFPSL